VTSGRFMVTTTWPEKWMYLPVLLVGIPCCPAEKGKRKALDVGEKKGKSFQCKKDYSSAPGELLCTKVFFSLLSNPSPLRGTVPRNSFFSLFLPHFSKRILLEEI